MMAHSHADSHRPGRTATVDRVVETLRQRMSDGSLAPGERIGEAEFAGRLGVSRTPIREAIGRLAAEGLLEVVTNRGARVAEWTTDRLAEIFDLRLQLETHAVRLAAATATEDDIAYLHGLAEYMVVVGTPGPTQNIAELDLKNREFHQRLIDTAQRPTLTAALSTAKHAALIRHNYEIFDTAAMLRSLSHHREIVQALRARDGEWAEAVMRAHLCNARAALLSEPAPGQQESD